MFCFPCRIFNPCSATRPIPLMVKEKQKWEQLLSPLPFNPLEINFRWWMDYFFLFPLGIFSIHSWYPSHLGTCDITCFSLPSLACQIGIYVPFSLYLASVSTIKQFCSLIRNLENLDLGITLSAVVSTTLQIWIVN